MKLPAAAPAASAHMRARWRCASFDSLAGRGSMVVQRTPCTVCRQKDREPDPPAMSSTPALNAQTFTHLL
jgi:hypothetical protein